VLEPQLVDGDHDGRIDSLIYRYAMPAESVSSGERSEAAALTIFVDFNQRVAAINDPLDRIPVGLWGMENRGRFRFDLFLTIRADNVTAVGYVNGDGIVDEIRIGRSGNDKTTVVWHRDRNGVWKATNPSILEPLVDSSRFGSTNLARLRAVIGTGSAAPTDRVPRAKSIP
jgi:hypothetical protein